MKLHQFFLKFLFSLAIGLFSSLSWAQASTVQLAQIPMLALKSAPGLVMLNMSRDNRLYYAAYNDISDLNGDGAIDVGFKPAIEYYGYFASDRCYSYDATGTAKFVPVSIASTSDGCRLSAGRWHGNWLNWALTSRMDALRKVLYGGFRRVDTAAETVLEAVNIPGDSHVWGKEYRRKSVGGPDSYDIPDYTPLPTPGAGQMHILLVKSEGDVATVYQNRQVPTVRIIQNVDAVRDRVWQWSSSERPIGGANGNFGYTRPQGSVVNGLPVQSNTVFTYGSLAFPAAYTMQVRVQTCVSISGNREKGCVGYPSSSPTNWKPTGVLHDFGVNDQLKFGLLTGSYLNNYSGGVVRKNISSFTDEFSSSTGIFNNSDGIYNTINRLQTYGFNGNGGYDYLCGFNFTSLRTQGQCHMWGAPIAEMMYESLRYFGGLTATPAFTTGIAAASSPDTRLGLPLPAWQNPYRPKASGGNPICSKPVQMVIADPITSFDSDQLPGAAFAPVVNYGGTLAAGSGNLNPVATLNVTTEADRIWNIEHAGATNFITTINGVDTKYSYPAGTMLGSNNRFFIGQTTFGNADGNPTPKLATTFSTMRGHGPDETNTQGSYHAASVARYARQSGIQIRTSSLPSASTTVTPVDQISIALGAVVPKIEIPYQGQTVTLVPLSKSVGGGGVSNAIGAFQATGLITLVYFDSIYNTSPANASATFNGGRPYMRFMASFSDMDQGGDNEADANVYYTVFIDASNRLRVDLQSYYQAGSIRQNMGYIISGTTNDGVYLEVGDEPNNPVYYLDTLAGQSPAPATGRVPANTTSLPLAASRTFTLGAATAGGQFVPKDPLWYAAKYGGAGIFDAKGNPNNFFEVTNASLLPEQMGKAFRSAAALAAVASTSVVGTGQRGKGTAAIYQAVFDSLTWSSRMYAFPLNNAGVVDNSFLWEGSNKLSNRIPARNMYLGQGGSTTPKSLAQGLAGYTALSAAEKTNFGSNTIYDYLTKNISYEERNGGTMRNRGSTAPGTTSFLIGDIVNSDPQVLGSSIKRREPVYPDATYTSFLSGVTSDLLAVGSNDGFFRIFNGDAAATGGAEMLAFMPQAAQDSILDLSKPGYIHRFSLDGPIGTGFAKISTPADGTTKWRTIAIGTGGAGVKTVFAIDVGTPNGTTTLGASNVMWELNTKNIPNAVSNTFGNMMSKPIIGKIRYNGGTWVAVFGNGYNSANGGSYLYVVDLSTGAVIDVRSTDVSITSSGIGTVRAVNKTGGEYMDGVYAADFKGNIWRFDLSGLAKSSWKPTWIFQTPSGRPITADLIDGPAPASKGGGRMIYFGTGSYLAASDPANTDTQALYGIYDDLANATLPTIKQVNQSQLNQMSIINTGVDTRETTKLNGTPTIPAWFTDSTKRGWFIPLTSGERVVATPVLFGSSVIFTSIVPGVDDCAAGVDAWLTGVDAMSGGYTKVFDVADANSLLVRGGSPRGVFILDDDDALKPVLYVSQTLFPGANSSTTYTSSRGGNQENCVGGVCNSTSVLGITLFKKKEEKPPPNKDGIQIMRQVWRQLK
jgi:type IV pilus assembly protein PilY1